LRVNQKVIVWTCLTIIVAIFVLSVGPWLLTLHPMAGTTAEQMLKARNDVRTTLIQGVGAAGLVGGLFFSYRTFRLTTSQQMTDRYTRAVEQLGSTSEDVRIGAIFALDRIVTDSPRDRASIVAVLGSFARRRTSVRDAPDTLPADAQAALTVIGRRRSAADQLSLAGASLRGLELSSANLRSIRFQHADLTKAILSKCDAQDAAFTGSTMTEISLHGSNLDRADLRGADLSGGDISETSLVDADLKQSKLDRARVRLGSLTDRQISSLAGEKNIAWLSRSGRPEGHQTR
jgi:hypothetical protein